MKLTVIAVFIPTVVYCASESFNPKSYAEELLRTTIPRTTDTTIASDSSLSLTVGAGTSLVTSSASLPSREYVSQKIRESASKMMTDRNAEVGYEVRLQTAQKMLHEGYAVSQIIEITSLKEDDILSIPPTKIPETSASYILRLEAAERMVESDCSIDDIISVTKFSKSAIEDMINKRVNATALVRHEAIREMEEELHRLEERKRLEAMEEGRKRLDVWFRKEETRASLPTIDSPLVRHGAGRPEDSLKGSLAIAAPRR